MGPAGGLDKMPDKKMVCKGHVNKLSQALASGKDPAKRGQFDTYYAQYFTVTKNRGQWLLVVFRSKGTEARGSHHSNRLL